MFDLGGEAPPSYYYQAYSLLFLGLIVLPLGYGILCWRMRLAAVPRSPVVPYFCVFGSVGGYCLIAGLSPSVFTLLIVPFAPLALISLAVSLVAVCRSHPFTSYHRGAAICCSVLLLLPLLAIVGILMGGN
jgi:hypothetical protein